MEGKVSILLVDDHPQNLLALETCLASLGQNLVKARSGKEALRCLLREDFAAIVLDVQMPGMDGFETAQLVRQRERSQRTPIIFVTAIHRSEEDVMRGYSLGAVDYVFSPYPPAIINAKVSAIVELVKSTQQVKQQAARLAAANQKLAEEIGARHRAEADVRKLNVDLEERVLERTAQLEKANRDQQVELVERRRAESGLRIAQQRLNLILRSFPMGIYTALPSAELATTWISENAERITGFPAQRFVEEASLWASRLHPEDREPVRQAFENIRQTGSIQVEYRWQCADDSYHWFLDQGIVLPDNEDSARQVLGIWMDVTERKKLEAQFRQAQKMEAIGRLAGGVAHDFNNLLTIITGYSDLLLEQEKSGSQFRAQIEEIRKAAGRAATLTRQLLAFGRRQVLAPQVLNLNKIVANMDKMLQRLIGEDIHLVTNLAPALSRTKVDPSQVEQVIMNLAVNSRDAMPEGGKLTIETADAELDANYALRHAMAAPGRFVMLAVSDNGCGMDAETQSHIFEPFFTTKETGKGTGLGLATVYGIVKQIGGEIWVYSEPSRGTTFKVYFPQVEEAEQTVQPPKVVSASYRGSESILVVEDEEAVRSLVRRVLESKGYTVLTASTAEEAARMCEQRERTISLLLTDIVMPGMSGRKLAHHLGFSRPEMKILYMSGYTDNAIVHHGVLDPGTAFLQKPFTPDAVLRKVREVLDAPPALERPSASGAPS